MSCLKIGMVAAARVAAICAACTAFAEGKAEVDIGFDPAVPFSDSHLGIDGTCEEMARIKASTGLHRFFLRGPGFNGVMFGPFGPETYSDIGKRLAAVREKLADPDVELSWWCTPSIRYFSDFPSIEDSKGNRSKDNKKCPLDEAFAADYAAKVKSVAVARPKIINIEDDYTLAWGRGLNGLGACFCKRHLADFAKRFGRELSAAEIAAAFENRTPENRAVRQAFADSVRESLVSLARKVRAAVDEVDPSIRIMLCESGSSSDKDGDALEAVARAFAGRNRPAVRESGAIYSAETTPASIPRALSHTMWTLEHLSPDVETFYESDVYPHNRFYSSASQLISMMAGAAVMGTDNFLFYCLQYLDDPMEDRGYIDAFLAIRPRLETVRRFIRERGSKLSGVRIAWTTADSYLVRGCGTGHGVQLACGSYLLSKFGVPYTTRADADGVALLTGEVVETMSDGEIRELFSRGLIVDADAAALLAKRGFSEEMGVDVEVPSERPKILDEQILPAAGCRRRGKHTNAFYIFTAGAEGSVSKFVTLRPRAGTEVWSEYYDVNDRAIMPALTVSGVNRSGGRTAVFSSSLAGNRSSGLFNLRKQEVFANLLGRLSSGRFPVLVRGVPGIWTLASTAADGRSMLLSVNNLSGDVREGVEFAFSEEWADADVCRIAEDGSAMPLGRTSAAWKAPIVFGQMAPEFFVIQKRGKTKPQSSRRSTPS